MILVFCTGLELLSLVYLESLTACVSVDMQYRLERLVLEAISVSLYEIPFESRKTRVATVTDLARPTL